MTLSSRYFTISKFYSSLWETSKNYLLLRTKHHTKAIQYPLNGGMYAWTRFKTSRPTICSFTRVSNLSHEIRWKHAGSLTRSPFWQRLLISLVVKLFPDHFGCVKSRCTITTTWGVRAIRKTPYHVADGMNARERYTSYTLHIQAAAAHTCAAFTVCRVPPRLFIRAAVWVWMLEKDGNSYRVDVLGKPTRCKTPTPWQMQASNLDVNV